MSAHDKHEQPVIVPNTLERVGDCSQMPHVAFELANRIPRHR